MNIRRFVPDDFEDILSIEQEAFSDHNPLVYINFYEMNVNGFLVAVEDNTIVGFVVGYQLNENEGRIFSLAVKDGYKGRGIGTRLIHSILKVFYENTFQTASLEVRISNVRAQQLYQRIGFVPCWIEKKYYFDGEDGVIMKMRTSPQCSSCVLANSLQEHVIPTRHEPVFKNPGSI
ncbi:MAG: ribosomal protein S18-alanine N-acetyltransferase [Methanosarcinaceae archaeon]|nr:ribosomal protein S18-alanine N-acetyltransferase [Methanosarcinaceae archaeon]MDF1533298.1 ribosomal protein S18-alanine N-acetyltransferase [Methanosarcinaceae archaeon]